MFDDHEEYTQYVKHMYVIIIMHRENKWWEKEWSEVHFPFLFKAFFFSYT